MILINSSWTKCRW